MAATDSGTAASYPRARALSPNPVMASTPGKSQSPTVVPNAMSVLRCPAEIGPSFFNSAWMCAACDRSTCRPLSSRNRK